MILNKLAILLVERQLKITRVSNDTQISRTTLTSLVQNENKMIQNETINKLCRYLNVTPCDFFEYVPFDVTFTVSIDDNLKYDPDNGEPLTWGVEAFMNIDSNSEKKIFEYSGEITSYGPHDGKDHLEGFLEPASSDEEQSINTFFSNVSTSFITNIEQQLENEFYAEAKKEGYDPYHKKYINVNLLSKFKK